MISFNHIYQIQILDLQMLVLMMLVVIYKFPIRYQKNFRAAQPINVEFKLDEVVPNITGYALVLTKELVSVRSDGQKHFDFI